MSKFDVNILIIFDVNIFDVGTPSQYLRRNSTLIYTIIFDVVLLSIFSLSTLISPLFSTLNKEFWIFDVNIYVVQIFFDVNIFDVGTPPHQFNIHSFNLHLFIQLAFIKLPLFFQLRYIISTNIYSTYIHSTYIH